MNVLECLEWDRLRSNLGDQKCQNWLSHQITSTLKGIEKSQRTYKTHNTFRLTNMKVETHTKQRPVCRELENAMSLKCNMFLQWFCHTWMASFTQTRRDSGRPTIRSSGSLMSASGKTNTCQSWIQLMGAIWHNMTMHSSKAWLRNRFSSRSKKRPMTWSARMFEAQSWAATSSQWSW